MSVFRRDEKAQRAVAAVFDAPRPLTAAAAQIKINDKAEVEQFKSRRSSASSEWQSEAWEYYDAIGEIKYAFNLVASVVSRIRLYPAVIENTAQTPVPASESDLIEPRMAEAAERALRRLDSAFGGQAGLLKDAALNLSVAGECYLVQMPARPGQGLPESWDIRSVDEILPDIRGWMVRGRRDAQPGSAASAVTVLPDRAFIGRIWRSHPRYSDEADSSLRGLLDLCDELLLLSRTFRATARSRLNAGALYLPDGLSVAAQGDPDYPLDNDDDLLPGSTAEEAEDDFEEQLIDAMTTPIRDESSASAVVPLIIRGPAELGDKIKQFKFERSFDPALAQRADRVLERILQGLDVPKDVVTGLANVKYCVPLDTEVLTKSGWKRGDEISIHDEIYTLNHETGEAEWQYPSAINVFDYDSDADGPLYEHTNASFASLSTDNHRWAVIKTGKKVKGSRRRFTTSAGLTSTDRIQIAAASVDIPVKPSWRDEFAELVGWYTTEGSLINGDNDSRRKFIQITQSLSANPVKAARIRRVLTSLFGSPASSRAGTPSWIECQYGEIAMFLLNHEASEALISVAPGKDKAVSREFLLSLTREQLQVFVEAAFEGDGSYYGEHRGVSGSGVHAGILWQKSYERLESIAFACTLLGLPIRYYTKPDASLHGIRLKKRAVIQPLRNGSTRREFKGQVWCPTTPNGTWLARREGTVYFTGNSNALQIDESLYKAHIEPLMLLLADALTVVYFRPALIAMGFAPADVERMVVWYDPSAVSTRNDRAADADAGFDRGAISYDTWRRAHGFDDNDAPTAAELAIRMLFEKGGISPELTEAMLTALAPELMGATRNAAQGASVGPIPTEVQKMLDGGQPAAEAAPEAPAVEAAPAAQPAAQQQGDTPPVAPNAPITPAPTVPQSGAPQA